MQVRALLPAPTEFPHYAEVFRICGGSFFVRGHYRGHYLSLPAFFVDQIRHEVHRLCTHGLHFMCINIQCCADFRMTQTRRNGLDIDLSACNHFGCKCVPETVQTFERQVFTFAEPQKPVVRPGRVHRQPVVLCKQTVGRMPDIARSDNTAVLFELESFQNGQHFIRQF